jgi:dihydrofolate reductase
MGNVIYSFGVSLDGFIARPGGEIDWTTPDEELHRFHNQEQRKLGVQLCGRRLYETMVYWDTVDLSTLPPEGLEFAEVWRPQPKIVFSTTLESVEGNATLKREGLLEEVTRLKQELDNDIAVGGAGLASSLIAAGLVDEYRLFIRPVVLGAGRPYFPPLDHRIELELIEARTFGHGVQYLRYRAAALL